MSLRTRDFKSSETPPPQTTPDVDTIYDKDSTQPAEPARPAQYAAIGQQEGNKGITPAPSLPPIRRCTYIDPARQPNCNPTTRECVMKLLLLLLVAAFVPATSLAQKPKKVNCLKDLEQSGPY